MKKLVEFNNKRVFLDTESATRIAQEQYLNGGYISGEKILYMAKKGDETVLFMTEWTQYQDDDLLWFKSSNSELKVSTINWIIENVLEDGEEFLEKISSLYESFESMEDEK